MMFTKFLRRHLTFFLKKKIGSFHGCFEETLFIFPTNIWTLFITLMEGEMMVFISNSSCYFIVWFLKNWVIQIHCRNPKNVCCLHSQKF